MGPRAKLAAAALVSSSVSPKDLAIFQIQLHALGCRGILRKTARARPSTRFDLSEATPSSHYFQTNNLCKQPVPCGLGSLALVMME
eukprot:scaffold21688_cov146-Skeletonema_dohrnii-CCMP3373.AAC.3